MPNLFSPIGIAFLLILYVASCIKILKEYERGVMFTLGRLGAKPKGPGLFLVFHPIQQMVKISLRTLVLDVPPQDVITKDNVSIKVNAVVYFRVMEPNKAVTEVEDYLFATSQISQTTLRSILGQAELDDLLSQREDLNAQLQEIIDKHTDPWGIKVSSVEVKHVDLPDEMRRAMAKQAEAEREKRAKIIGADAEFLAAAKLVEAAKMMADHPMALQMRYLQTLADIASENNSTTLFPIPIDLLKPFLEKKDGK